jgi:hypothetical protein
MALFTASIFFFPKLAAMRILMAIGATEFQRLITHETRCFILTAVRRKNILARMAFFARHFLMRARQRKTRGVVIELGLKPRLIPVTNFTTAFRQARRKLAGVYILMTSLAALIRKHKQQLAGKRPGLLASVTESTGDCEMAAEQRKIRLLVRCDREL